MIKQSITQRVFTFTPLLTALLLAGCASSDGLRTSNNMLSPDSLQAQQSLANVHLSPVSWPKQNWWQSFNDPQLNALITEGLASSPDLQEVNARADKANAAVVASQAERYPDLDVNAGITRSRVAKVDDPMLQGKSYSTLRTASLGLSYSLDLWGGKKAAWEAALGQAKAAEVDKQAAQLTLAANVTRAWINLNLAWEMDDLAKENAQRLHQMAGVQEQFYSKGLTPVYQYKQALASDKDAQGALLAAEQNITEAGIKLSTLIGKGPDRWHSLHRTKLAIPAQLTLPSSVPAELLGRRPDIVAARWRVESAEKNIQSVKTEFYPNINLVAEAGSRNLIGDAFFGAPSRFFNVGPTISLPIFDGGKRRADLASSDADWDLAVAHYNSLVISSLGSISSSITQVQSLEQQIAQAQDSDQLAHDAWDDVSAQFKAGIRPWLDVLSLQSQLIESERNVVQLKADAMSQSVALIEQLGGGFNQS
jgi:efflux transporter, outer membrane factor (OMF) lipoprotein, NodT family